MRCRESWRPHSTVDSGEPGPPGPDRGKGGVTSLDPLGGNDGGTPEFQYHVNETTVDSRTGAGAPGKGLPDLERIYDVRNRVRQHARSGLRGAGLGNDPVYPATQSQAFV